MSIFKFFEKEKPADWKPKTARQFAGFPVELEWRELKSPCEDDRIMFDGRPAYAWWAEIEDYRRQQPQREKAWRELAERFRILRIAEWVIAHDYNTFDVLIRFKQSITANPDDIEGQLSVEPLERKP